MATAAGANVQHPVLATGHQLPQTDLAIGQEWIKAVRFLQADKAAVV